MSVRWLLLWLLVAGCAANTPVQQRTYDAWRQCEARGRIHPQVTLERVEPSGRWWWRTRDGSFGVAEATRCMAEQMR